MESDLATLAQSVASGDPEARAQLRDDLGVEADDAALAWFVRIAKKLAGSAYRGIPTLATLLGAIRRAVDGADPLVWERSTRRRIAWHVLVVRFDTPEGPAVCVGVGDAFGSTRPSAVWPALDPWKNKLAENEAVLLRWAQDRAAPVGGHSKVLLPVSRRTRLAPDAQGEAGLLAAIRARPDDDAPRLVYADWLSERGDPRAELVRLQVTGGSEAAARVHHLLEAHRQEFAGELSPWVKSNEDFERGLVARVHLTVASFAKQGEDLFRRWPLRGLDVDGKVTAAQLERLAVTPALGLVKSLALTFGSWRRTDAAPLSAFAASKHLGGLEQLSLRFAGHSAADWERGLSALDAPRLRRLNLGGNATHPALIHALADERHCPALEVLDEYVASIIDQPTPKQWRDAFAALSGRISLRAVSLASHDHLQAAAMELFGSKSRAPLEVFELGGTISPSDVEQIHRSGQAKTLRALWLRAGALNDASIGLILELPRLEHLVLAGTYGGDALALVERVKRLPAGHPLKRLGLPLEAPRGLKRIGQIEIADHDFFASAVRLMTRK